MNNYPEAIVTIYKRFYKKFFFPFSKMNLFSPQLSPICNMKKMSAIPPMNREGHSQNQGAWHLGSKHFLFPKVVGVCHGNPIGVLTLRLALVLSSRFWLSGNPWNECWWQTASAGSPLEHSEAVLRYRSIVLLVISSLLEYLQHILVLSTRANVRSDLQTIELLDLVDKTNIGETLK